MDLKPGLKSHIDFSIFHENILFIQLEIVLLIDNGLKKVNNIYLVLFLETFLNNAWGILRSLYILYTSKDKLYELHSSF